MGVIIDPGVEDGSDHRFDHKNPKGCRSHTQVVVIGALNEKEGKMP